MTDSTRYGYIGIGDMGGAMAERLLTTGHDVLVFDLEERAVGRLVDEFGATAAGSAAEVAAGSDIVGICVPAAHHIEAVMTGDDGIVEGAHEGLTLLIHSTVHPDTVRQARDTAAAWGVSVFDACVGGGTPNARAGDLVVFAGGTDEMSAPVRALLDRYAGKLIEAGPIGAGAAVKIGFNVMTYAQFCAAKAALELVEEAGAERESLIESWRHVDQLGAMTERFLPLLGRAPETIQGDFRDYMAGQVEIAQKDVTLALGVSADDAAMAPFLRVVHDGMPSVYGVA